MTGTLLVTVDNWEEIRDGLRALGPRINRSARRRLRRPAQRIVDLAKSNAQREGLVQSGDLIASIRVAVSGGVSVRAGTGAGGRAPHARIWELGGRWPIFGNRDNWTGTGVVNVNRDGTTTQTPPARPFFYPAIDEIGPEGVAEEIFAEVADIAEGLGLPFSGGTRGIDQLTGARIQ